MPPCGSGHSLSSWSPCGYRLSTAGMPPARRRPGVAKAEAIGLNNLGVASMNQQKPEAALERFEAAAKADPR